MADPIQAQLNPTNFMIDQMIKYLNLSRDRVRFICSIDLRDQLL